MKKQLAVAVIALAATAPAHALSIVSLHLGGAPGGGSVFSVHSVDGMLILGGLLALGPCSHWQRWSRCGS
jgi:hypothetical protein